MCVCVFTEGLANLRGHIFGGFYPDGGVPLSWRQHCHLVQELVDACYQVSALLGLVCHVMEHLGTQP